MWFCKHFCSSIFCCNCCDSNIDDKSVLLLADNKTINKEDTRNSRDSLLKTLNRRTKILPKNKGNKFFETEEIHLLGVYPEQIITIKLDLYGRKPVKKIVCGKSHCLLLINNNNLFGTGSNENGQLGLPTEIPFSLKIEDIPICINNIQNIENSQIIDFAAGDDFSLIQLKSTINNKTFLVRFASDKKNKYLRKTNILPQKLAPLPNEVNEISLITAFGKRESFVTENNAIYIGGMDFYGTKIDYFQFLAKFNIKIKSIYLQKESCIIIDNQNNIYCIGDNSYNELSLSCDNNLTEFKPINLFKITNNQIKKVSTGARHLLILLDNGELYCVGDNSQGQCCVATEKIRIPFKLQLNDNKKIIDCYAGYNHNLVILEDGKVYTWGNSNIKVFGAFDGSLFLGKPQELIQMRIKCISNVSLGDQFSVITSGQMEDSIVYKEKAFIKRCASK